jgi:ABC-type glutathione transport system ATPase component
MTVMEIVSEPLRIHGLTKPGMLKAQVVDLLEKVGLRPHTRIELQAQP